VQIRELAPGWSLVGDGPGYLLFCPNKEVIHLSCGLDRALRRDLQGRAAFDKCGELEPLVQAFALASPGAIYGIDSSPDAVKRKRAAYVVMREIEQIICLFPHKPKIFTGRLRRLNTLIKAAAILAMYYGPPEAPGVSSLPRPPGSFVSRDPGGRQILVINGTQPFVFRYKPDSSIARCAQTLWREKDPTKPYRVPTRKDLREHLCCDEATVTKLARAEGFTWLPRAPAGRPRRRRRREP
jgi:hypothetical protein